MDSRLLPCQCQEQKLRWKIGWRSGIFTDVFGMLVHQIKSCRMRIHHHYSRWTCYHCFSNLQSTKWSTTPLGCASVSWSWFGLDGNSLDRWWWKPQARCKREERHCQREVQGTGEPAASGRAIRIVPCLLPPIINLKMNKVLVPLNPSHTAMKHTVLACICQEWTRHPRIEPGFVPICPIIC